MTSLQYVEAFSPAQHREEQNREGHGPQSGQYLHSWGGTVTDGIKAGLVIQCGLRDTTLQSVHSWGGTVTDGIKAGLVIQCGLRDTTLQSGP